MHKNSKNHKGVKYNYLTGIKQAGNIGCMNAWIWKCDCGNKKAIPTSSVIRGRIKSCGCMKGILLSRSKLKHGHSTCEKSGGGSPEYRSWNSMRSRCLNTTDKDYKNYGARGIKICDSWLGSFENFLADMGKKPSRLHTIDRINNDGNYEPANCRWATIEQQSSNKRTNRLFTFKGETKTIAQWARSIGCSRQALRYRINAGVDISDALSVEFNHSNRLC